MTTTSIHEAQRRLRVLTRHLARHPLLPPVSRAGTDFVAHVEVTVASEAGTAGFLAWAATLEYPRVHGYGAEVGKSAMLRCTGRLGGDTVSVTAHVDDLPHRAVHEEPLPLFGFRHLLAQTGWTAASESEAV